ncbi:MAG: hypothetical protein HKP01_04445 [Gemmatimonadetes bacterium]|nr:hypothetical protein [Gemmatimonadota bacterium]
MSREAPPSVDEDRLRAAYELLRSVVAEKAARTGSVRDSEVKRQMVEKDPNFDEAALGFRKFSRFLRQAHDEEVINLERTGEGNYKISAVAGGDAATGEAPAAGDSGDSREEKGKTRGRRDRGDRSSGRRGRGGRASDKDRDEPTAAPSDKETVKSAEPVAEAPGADVEKPVADAPVPEPSETAGEAAAAPTRLTGRKRRSPKPKAGKTIVPGPVDSPPAATQKEPEKKKDSAPARPSTRTMGRFRRGSRAAGAAPAGGANGTATASGSETRPEPDAAQGTALSDGQADLGEKMARGYQGVGRRTAERLVEEFGDQVLDVIDNQPGRIESILPKGRAQAVIDGRRAEREGGDG